MNQVNETPSGFFIVYLPEETLKLAREIQDYTGLTIQESIGESIREKVENLRRGNK